NAGIGNRANVGNRTGIGNRAGIGADGGAGAGSRAGIGASVSAPACKQAGARRRGRGVTSMANRLIICGSPRSRGRSAGLAEAVRFAWEDAFPNDRVELVRLSDVRVAPCTGCEACASNVGRDELYCIIADDMARIRRLLNACDELA